MKILIIGAKGMLGQALCEAFAPSHAVLAWDREEIDITDLGIYRNNLFAARPDLIINAAAYTDVDGAEANPEIANAINGAAVGNLAALAKQLGSHIIHYSTEYVFDGTKQEGYREDDVPNPISVYGQSKLLGEQELMKNADKYYLIRLSRLFGRSGGGKKSFVEKILELAQSKSEIEVIDEEVSCPTYAKDLAEATVALLESGQGSGIYHLPNTGACTWYQFADEVFKLSKKDVKLKPVPGAKFARAAKRPAYAELLNTKFITLRPWAEALDEFLKS